jgi:hypothetical protein
MSKREHLTPARVLHIDLKRNTMTWSFVDKGEGLLHQAKAGSREWPRALSWLFGMPKKS